MLEHAIPMLRLFRVNLKSNSAYQYECIVTLYLYVEVQLENVTEV